MRDKIAAFIHYTALNCLVSDKILIKYVNEQAKIINVMVSNIQIVQS